MDAGHEVLDAQLHRATGRICQGHEHHSLETRALGALRGRRFVEPSLPQLELAVRVQELAVEGAALPEATIELRVDEVGECQHRRDRRWPRRLPPLGLEKLRGDVLELGDLSLDASEP